MESNLEISVINLILNATLFTKAVLMLLLLISIVSWAIMIHKYLFLNIYKSDISRFLKTISNQSGDSFIEETCIHFSKGTAKNLPILIAKMLKVRSQGKIIQSPETVVNNAAMYEAEKTPGRNGDAFNCRKYQSTSWTSWNGMGYNVFLY